MVDLLVQFELEFIDQQVVYLCYFFQLEKEYVFWMNGEEQVSVEILAVKYVVCLLEGEIFNCYWDEGDYFWEEMYCDDIEMVEKVEGCFVE